MPERKRFLLRIDPRLYAALERWAAAELRSVNAQIEYLLTEAAKKAGRLKPADVEGAPGEDAGAAADDDAGRGAAPHDEGEPGAEGGEDGEAGFRG